MKSPRNFFIASIAWLLSAFALPAFAGKTEEHISKVMQHVLNVPIQQVTKTEYNSLYEVFTAQGIVYTDAQAKFFIPGVIVNTATRENITELRMDHLINKLQKFDFSTLPFADAIKTVRGNGKRIMVTIEDPNCGFCKRLAPELQKLDNVTIYTFLTPILGEDSVSKSKAILCASDRATAWNDYMQKSTLPTTPSDACQATAERNQELFRKLQVTGTPTMLFKDGTRIRSFVDADKIEAKLGK